MIFKKNISDELEDKIIDLISKHKVNIDFRAKSENAMNKANKANKRMQNSVLVSGFGAALGVGGLATALKLGVGAISVAAAGTTLTVGGAILFGGVIGITAPAIAYMSINKLIKVYHESVAKKNNSMFGHIAVENKVKDSFESKLIKAIGGMKSEGYDKGYKTGILSELRNGINLEENTKKIIEMAKSSKNEVKETIEQKIKRKFD